MSGISQNLRRKVKGGGEGRRGKGEGGRGKGEGGRGGESGEGEEAVCYVREREILLEYSRMITLLLDAGQKISEKKMGG